VLDRPDEAVLVRCSPRPSAADVMTAYNARAHTSLLRGCEELALRCAGPHASIERTVRTWTDALGVEASVEGDTACLRGQTDALGSWSRHGRKLERITLELLADREVDAREARGRLTVGERECAFTWSRETLAGLGAGLGSTRGESLPARIDALALRLRAEREREGLTGWRIGRPGHLVGAAGAVFLSHLELRQGDRSLYVRLAPESPEASALEALERFRGKTAVALLEWPSGEAPPVLHLPGQAGEALAPDTLLAALGERLLGAPPARVTPAGRPALLAA